MQITDLRRVRGSLYKVELDGQPAGAVDRRTMDDAGWRVDSTLTERQWEELLEQSARNRCRDKALYWLSLRDRSRGELLRKLKEEYDPDLAAATVDRMTELGLIDDEALAARWAEELVRRKHYSRRRVEQELLVRGFDRECARQAAADLQTDDGEQALAILRKKYYNHRKTEDGRRKAAAALARYGFSRDAVRRAFEDWENED